MNGAVPQSIVGEPVLPRSVRASPDIDRLFFVGGAVLVPLPVVLFLVLRGSGLPTNVSEDLVTLAVMIPLGGPHVFATLVGTFGEPGFWRGDRRLAAASVALLVLVVATTIASAFHDLRLAGTPPMTFLLTAFFFWAGLHVAQQHCHVVSRLGPDTSGAWWRGAWIDRAVVLLALYPVSLFRMSMAAHDASGNVVADPHAIATRLVRGLGGSEAFADDYVFRIGRATPILPEIVTHPAVWIGVTAAFLTSGLLFAIKSVHARRRGEQFGTRGRLVLTMAVCGSMVPLVPNLDCAFQGLNAWHCVQYLRLSTVEHRESVARGERRSPFLASLVRPGDALRAYCVAVASTLVLVLLIVTLAFALEAASGGRFVLSGHDVAPIDASTGRALYRPGSLLLSYYLLGFGLLLVHYLLDTVSFARGRGRGVSMVARRLSN